MIKEKSIIERISMLTMPFLAFLIAIFANFVQFGFKQPDTNWYWQIVVNIVLLLSFWLPGKAFAVQKALDMDTIKTLKENYLKQCQQYYDKQERKAFREHLELKHRKEVEKYINDRLEESEVTEEVFVKKYKNNNAEIRKAVKEKSLTAKQGQLLKSANKFIKIKPITTENIIPNIIKQSPFKKNYDTYKTASGAMVAKKIIKIMLVGLAISMIFVNPTQSDNAMAIITTIFLKLLSSVLSLLSGMRTGKYLVTEKYAQDLASKTDELDEFHADKTSEYNKQI